MKKSELIKALEGIQGDPIVKFCVDADVCAPDDFAYWFTDVINNISKKTLYSYPGGDQIYNDFDDLKDEICGEKSLEHMSNEEIDSIAVDIINTMLKEEVVEISIGV